MFKKPFRLESRILAAAALLFSIAQFGAIAHAYAHHPLAESSAIQHPASAFQPKQASHELCGDCLNYAPLLAPAGTPAALPFALQQNQSAPSSASSASLVDHRTYAFRSRAPPLTP